MWLKPFCYIKFNRLLKQTAIYGDIIEIDMFYLPFTLVNEFKGAK